MQVNESERISRLVMEQLPAVFWTVDRDLRFTSMQAPHFSDQGWDPKQGIGMALASLWEGEGARSVIEAHTRALDGHSGSYETLWGGRTWQAHVDPLRDGAGAVIGVIGIALDISERIAAAEQLRQSNDELATYHDLVTHDVGNFSMALLGILERLLSGADGALVPEQVVLLRRANRQGLEVSRLAENAKMLARLRRDGLPEPAAPVALDRVIARAVETIGALHFDRDFDIQVDCADGLTVAGCPFLANVFINVLDNAVRYAPREERVVVRVVAARVGGMLRVVVRGGCPENGELVEGLFGRYARGRRSTGSGLGLAVVREVLRRAGGDVEARVAREGDKPVFELTLSLQGG